MGSLYPGARLDLGRANKSSSMSMQQPVECKKGMLVV